MFIKRTPKEENHKSVFEFIARFINVRICIFCLKDVLVLLYFITKNKKKNVNTTAIITTRRITLFNVISKRVV